MRTPFIPNQFLRMGDVVYLSRTTQIVSQVHDQEPFYHRYFYSLHRPGHQIGVLYDNAYSADFRRVYRDGCLIWIAFGHLEAPDA